MSLWSHVWTGIGVFALAFGNAVGAVYMFRGNVPLVMLGVGLMFGGYQLLHYGVYDEGLVSLLPERRNATFPEQRSGTSFVNQFRKVIIPIGGIVVAVYLISQGFVIGAQAAVQTFTLIEMALSGLYIVGGYIAGHTAVHGVPL